MKPVISRSDFLRRRRLRRPVAWVLALTLVAACEAACSEKRAGGPSKPEQKLPQRIVSLSPSVTEILYGVGAFERVVAVSDYCTYPPAVKDLPRVGSWINSSLESVSALRPDLVVMTDAQAPFSNEPLHKLGLRTLVVPSRSLEDALSAIRDIGRSVGNEDQARELAAKTRSALEEVRRKSRDLPRPRVLCIVDRLPGTLRDLYSAAQGSFLAELVEIAGGRALTGGTPTGYGKINKEALVMLDPEVIIDMVQGSKGRLGEDPTAVWGELSVVTAVRKKRVHPVYDTSALHPSQFVSDTARRFAEIIHPEVFTRDDLR